MCETEIRIAYIKKHAYKDREETTHIKIGEEDIHHHTHTHTHISKIITMNVKMVIRPVYKKPKEAPKTTRRGKHSP